MTVPLGCRRSTVSRPSAVPSVANRMSRRALVYYRLYTHAGEDTSLRAFDVTEPALALPEDALLLNTSGATAHDPILLVQPERRAGLHNRPLLVLSDSEHGGIWTWGPSRWLSPSAGDIVHTDGIRRVEEDGWGKTTPAYMGVDRKGKTGCVLSLLPN
jgi:hypothetical protein